MALGGGTYTSQNKVLPGAYINFISAVAASASISDRGIAALPLELDWGVDGAVFTVTSADFQKDSLKIFGYPYGHEKLKGLRDLFKNIHTGYFYKIMNDGVAASNIYCTAKYKGVRGNDLKTVIAINVDDVTKVDVSTYLGNTLVDKQIATPNTDNLVDNEYVAWKENIVLEATSGLPLANGANGSAITSAEYQAALDALESYSFNALGCLSTTSEVKNLFSQYAKRLRDEIGSKFQLVLHRNETVDHEGVISVENNVLDLGALDSALVFWTTGAQAGCELQRSLTNRRYDGEYTPDVNYKQSQLEEALQSGKFIFHRVGDEVRVLEDINTFTTFTEEKSRDFGSNQTIRIIDQIANDVAVLFSTKYLGRVPNDADGRISLWNDVVRHHQQLQSIRAIEDFESDDVVVLAGDTKKAVIINDAITPINAMAQLYMTIIIE